MTDFVLKELKVNCFTQTRSPKNVYSLICNKHNKTIYKLRMQKRGGGVVHLL